jgi:hypothetical protein
VAELEKIAVGCGMPAKTLTLDASGDVRFQPSPDAKYERVDCVLEALKKAGMATNMGFVGSESYETGNQQ